MISSLFSHPWLLAALAAVLLPPLIEWLFRRRKQQVVLPTLRFLLQAEEQTKVRRQDRFLLLLRMLAIGVLVLALARPLWQHDWTGSAAGRQVVVLLDGTASMQQQVEVTTAFGLSQKKAAALIRALPAGTTVTVLHLGDRLTAVIEGESDLHTAAARVEGLRAGVGAAPAHAGLTSVRAYIDRLKLDHVELYVFSDFQKHTWMGPGKAEETARALAGLAGVSETYLVEVGGRAEFNLMTTQLRPAEYVMSAGMPVKFQAEVQWRGQPPPDLRVPVTFLVDGVKKDVREISLAAQPVALEFTYRFPKAGEYLVEVQVEGDEHRVDNRRYYLSQVAQDFRVLILDESAETASAESVFLARAIRPPSRPGMEKLSHFDPKTIHPLRSTYENLSAYAAVVLTGTGQLSESLVRQLERYVADGGNLWLFLGDSVNPYDYNKLLFRDGKGLLPCRLADRVDVPTKKDQEVSLRLGDAAHPALGSFARLAVNPDGAFTRYYRLEMSAESQVVLSLSDGTPALVEKNYGRGKVLLANMTAGPGWTYLPVLPEFLALAQELLRYLAGNPDAAVNLQVGDRFEQPVFVSTQHLLLRSPDGTKHRLTPQRGPGTDPTFRVLFADTTQQGLYQIEAIDAVLARRRFVVNPGTDESELSRLNQAEFRDTFGTSDWAWIGPEVAVEDFAANLHTVTELYPWLAWTLAALLAVESLLAWRFGRRREAVS